MSDDDNDTLNLLPVPPATLGITRLSTLEEHIDSDLEMCNAMMSASIIGWQNLKSVNQIPKMVVSTLMLLEKRRQLALRPTHAADRKNPKAFGYDPLD